MSQLCPCGSALEYSLCCQRYLSGDQVAPDPSHLMRSRYTAFVIKDADYLIKTWHPSCHAAEFRQDIEAGFALPSMNPQRAVMLMKVTSALSLVLPRIINLVPLSSVPGS